MARRAGLVDEKRLGSATDRGAPHFGVDRDLLRHFKIGRGVHVDMHHAFKMREDRHARFALHAGNQALPSARDDDVDRAVETAEHFADGLAIARRHELDRILRQPGRAQAVDQAAMDRSRASMRVRAAAQDHSVAGLERQRARIGSDVGPALEDDADHAERRANALDVQPVRAVPFGDDRTDRIGKRGNILK